jgi:hypothetical protein
MLELHGIIHRRINRDKARGEAGKDDHRRKLARWTGLEPATPGVTGRYSNQLSYHRALIGGIVG